jgi:hypothetical protein
VAEKLFQEIPSDKRKIDPCDKGKEFIGHQELSEKLGVDFYFATPDHSWERGLNEPTNGLSSDGSKSLILGLAESPPPPGSGKVGGSLDSCISTSSQQVI